MPDKPSAATDAFLMIAAAPNSTKEASQLLRLLGNATGDPALAKVADRLAGGAGDGLTPREAASAAGAARKKDLLDQVARLVAAGKGKTQACTLVARVFAEDIAHVGDTKS